MRTLKSVIVSGFATTAMLLAASTTLAQDQTAALKALDDALPGELLHNPFDIEWAKRGNDLKTKIVDAEALSSGQAISARIKKKQPKAWDSVLTVQIPEAIKKGEEIQVYYYVRTKKPAAGRDTGNITMFVGRNEEPYDYIISEDIYPGTEWKLMNVKGVAKGNFSEGKVKVEYQLGKAAQTVEFGPVYVSRLITNTES